MKELNERESYERALKIIENIDISYYIDSDGKFIDIGYIIEYMNLVCTTDWKICDTDIEHFKYYLDNYEKELNVRLLLRVSNYRNRKLKWNLNRSKVSKLLSLKCI